MKDWRINCYLTYLYQERSFAGVSLCSVIRYQLYYSHISSDQEKIMSERWNLSTPPAALAVTRLNCSEQKRLSLTLRRCCDTSRQPESKSNLVLTHSFPTLG